MNKKLIISLVIIIILIPIVALFVLKTKSTSTQKELFALANEIAPHQEAKTKTIDSQSPGQASVNWLIENADQQTTALWYKKEAGEKGWKIVNETKSPGDSFIEAEKDGKKMILSFIKEESTDPVSVTIEVVEPEIIEKFVKKPVINYAPENPENTHTNHVH